MSILDDQAYSLEVIERAREERQKGTFKRKILERKVRNFYYDDLTLECGHVATDVMSRAGLAMLVLDGPGATHDCGKCLEEWMKEAAAKR